jgi:1-acyl-sn-glycerol-3-phosphate acyltransferase
MNIFCYYLRQISIVFLILFTVVQYSILPPKLSIFPVLCNLIGSVINTTIRVHGNTDAFNNSNLLVMANHYDGLSDSNLLYNLHDKYNSINKIHSIVKADFLGNPNDKNIFYVVMTFVREAMLKSYGMISYKRGDRADGAVVKNKIKECLKNDINVLIYPEGAAHRNGIPVAFKQGSFDLAVENKMNILPITIKYNRDIGAEKWEPPNTKMIFDNEVDIYIHDVIRETDACYKANDPVALKHKVFNIISAPFGALANTPAA